MGKLKEFFTFSNATKFYKLATAIGVLLFMIYCVRIRFFPTGMVITDVFFFLLVMMSFSLISIFFILGWFSTSVIVSYGVLKAFVFLSKKIKTKEKVSCIAERVEKILEAGVALNLYVAIPAHLIMTLVNLVVILSAASSGKMILHDTLLSLLVTVIMFVMIPFINSDERIAKQDKQKHLVACISCIVLMFFILPGLTPVISDSSMKIIGVNREGVTFVLRGKDLEMARYLTGNSKQNVFFGSASFTGIGSNSLIKINGKRLVVDNVNMTMSY